MLHQEEIQVILKPQQSSFTTLFVEFTESVAHELESILTIDEKIRFQISIFVHEIQRTLWFVIRVCG